MIGFEAYELCFFGICHMKTLCQYVFSSQIQEYTMKYIIAISIMLFSMGIASMPGAQKLYTWTDENGVLHITDTPPPQKAQIEDVMTYRERTPEELKAIQQRKDQLRRDLDQDIQREQAREAQLKAQEAAEDAQAAREKADKEYEENKAYIDKLSNRKWKRKKFRKKIERLKKETEETYTEAQKAAERAEEAEQMSGQ